MVVSYLIAGLAAGLAGLCYTEFVVEQPIAGGAFNYIFLTFGELPAWCASSPRFPPPPYPVTAGIIEGTGPAGGGHAAAASNSPGSCLYVATKREENRFEAGPQRPTVLILEREGGPAGSWQPT